MEDDHSYYARRADAEWRTATMASDAETRRLHFELAEMLRVKSLLQQARTSAAVSRDRESAQ